MSKYLKFKEITNWTGKTKKYLIKSKRSGLVLGGISWYAPWRQYTFRPNSETIWNKDCLQDVQDFIQQLMYEWKDQKDADNFTGIYKTDGVDK